MGVAGAKYIHIYSYEGVINPEKYMSWMCMNKITETKLEVQK